MIRFVHQRLRGHSLPACHLFSWLVSINDHKIFHQTWCPAESSKSSTWRELRTTDLALSAFALELQGKKVAWFANNTSVFSIVHNESKITELKSLALLSLMFAPVMVFPLK